MNVIADRVKISWEKSNSAINSIKDVYDYKTTRELLLRDDFYKSLYGKGKNRSLIKADMVLYKSIYEHTKDLEVFFVDRFKNKISEASIEYYISFSKRVKFIAEYDKNFSLLNCNCGLSVTWHKYCRKCPEYHKTQTNRKHTDTTKLKMRVSTLKYISDVKGQICPRYNKKSIAIIEDFGIKNNYNFSHAENGGEYFIKELGYFLDAYDHENNVVLEIDESHHFDVYGNLKESDIHRQKEIESFLGCKFYRIKI
jgi:hypothetical protein